jgi:hypothetical protein
VAESATDVARNIKVEQSRVEAVDNSDTYLRAAEDKRSDQRRCTYSVGHPRNRSELCETGAIISDSGRGRLLCDLLPRKHRTGIKKRDGLMCSVRYHGYFTKDNEK